ncbi:MAG: hypothetical protein HFH51_05040 [Lachnospiraceae bacterium]|nr:hypothetical protein [Lachnospiraceae bacterium]
MALSKSRRMLCAACILVCVLAGCGGQTTQSENIMEQLPKDFEFSSGVGGWVTFFNLNPDGTFTGQYHDTDMGDTGENYPGGTVYICNFDGKFSKPRQVNEYIYSMELEYLNTERPPGQEYYEDGIRYLASEAYGFEDTGEFLIYLPGCPLAQTAEEFITWTSVNPAVRKTLPGGYYGIYNVNGKEGFVGMDEDSQWSRRYRLEQGTCRVELRPSYYDESHIMFFPEEGEALVNLCFQWEEDAQKEFQAYDSEGSGEYELSLSFSKDARTVKAAVKQKSLTEKTFIGLILLGCKGRAGYDFSPWGGRKAGTWAGELVYKP